MNTKEKALQLAAEIEQLQMKAAKAINPMTIASFARQATEKQVSLNFLLLELT